MATYGCPCCGAELVVGELAKGKCNSCGELFDNDDVVQTFVEEDFLEDVEGVRR